MSNRSRGKRGKTTTSPSRRSRVPFHWYRRESVIRPTELAYRPSGDGAPALDGGVPKRGGHRGKLRKRSWALARIRCQPRGPRSAVDQHRHFGRVGVCIAGDRSSALISAGAIRVSRPAAPSRGGHPPRRAPAAGWSNRLSLSVWGERPHHARGAARARHGGSSVAAQGRGRDRVRACVHDVRLRFSVRLRRTGTFRCNARRSRVGTWREYVAEAAAGDAATIDAGRRRLGAARLHECPGILLGALCIRRWTASSLDADPVSYTHLTLPT